MEAHGKHRTLVLVEDMKLQAFLNTMKTNTVSVSTIATKVANPTAPTAASVVAPTAPVNGEFIKVNTQASSAAPDSSGKNMVQFEALISKAGIGFSTLYEAEKFCIESARAAGFSNYANVSSDAGCYRILAW